MKIAIITERADIALGGAERSVFELSTALSSLGLNVDILAATGQTNTKNFHILCHNRLTKRACFCAFAKALKTHLAENHYDIIHSVLPFDFADIYQPRGGTYAESILRNAASYQNKFIESLKKITAFANFRRTILLQAERKLAQNPNGPLIVAISKYVAEQFKHHYATDSQRITVIPNGVKIRPQINPSELEILRKKIPFKTHDAEINKPILFLFAANNFRLKGLAALIKAMSLAAKNPQTKSMCLIVAGRDNPRTYLALAKKLSVQSKIVFLGKAADIQNILPIIDVAILPTFYDPSSRFILEALAAAKPVITTKYNGATDLFVNNRHGQVIDTPENIAALAEAVTCFTDAGNIKKTAQAIAADNLRGKVSINSSAKQLIPLYESILKKRRQQ